MAIITVGASGKDYTTINAAIDAAILGDTIEVTAGETFTENVMLNHKTSGAGYITIQSSALASLPTAGNRVSPADAANMPTIRSASAGSGSAFTASSGPTPSQYYKLVGLNILRHNSTSAQTAVITLGTSHNNIDHVPHHITIDRCLVRGADDAGTRRGILANAKNLEIINSYIDNFWQSGFDSQGILGYDGTQDLLIANNFIEGASENIMIGGDDSGITGFVPNNITVEHNHCFKRLAWMGAGKNVKNLFELKNARNVTVQNNIFENNWADGQAGTAILFTVRNQGGTSPQSTVEDVVFRYNIVKNTLHVYSVLITDDLYTSEVVHNIDINNNLSIANNRVWLMYGSPAQGPADNITFDHNTCIAGPHGQYGAVFVNFDESTDTLTNFEMTNNLVAGEEEEESFLGLVRSTTNTGAAALAQAAVADAYVFTGNLIQRSQGTMPGGNFYEATRAGIGLEDYAGGNYSLATSSAYKGAAPGGIDPGVDWAELQTRTATTESGTGWVHEVGEPAAPSVQLSGGVSISGGVRFG